MTREIDVSVVIVNWNTRELLRKSIQSVYEKTVGCRFEIIVVDNASNDGSVEMVREAFPAVHLIASGENMGFPWGNNQGISKSSGCYVLLLNSDTELINDALSILVKFMDENSDAGACGGKLRNADMSVQPSCGNFSSPGSLVFGSRSLKQFLLKFTRSDKNFPAPFLSYDEHHNHQEVDWVVGADLMVRREAIEDVGLMDENIFLYAEDWDYCYRIKDAGWKILYNPQAEIVHHGGKSTSNAADKNVATIFNSQLYFYAKHYGERRASLLKFMILVGALIKLCLWSVVLIGKREGKEYVKGKIGWHAGVLRWGSGKSSA